MKIKAKCTIEIEYESSVIDGGNTITAAKMEAERYIKEYLKIIDNAKFKELNSINIEC